MAAAQCICGSRSYNKLLSLPCGNFDNGLLYDPATIVACPECGHVFNLLTPQDKAKLARYYSEEYGPSNLVSPNTRGDLPGSLNANSLSRYAALFQLVHPSLHPTDAILDLGCASGGFLKFLKEKSFTILYGADFSECYVEQARQDGDLRIEQCHIEDVPFRGLHFDLVVADQVVEHLDDPNVIFSAATQLVAPHGHLCLSVPSAAHYDTCYFFDFYWFLMREHIHHFDYPGLVRVAARHGFLPVASTISFTNMTSPRTMLPSLMILFQRGTCPTSPSQSQQHQLPHILSDYIQHGYRDLAEKKQIFDSLPPLYVWGMSREFFYLWENTHLQQCTLLALIDENPFKQQHTVAGMHVHGPEALKHDDAVVLISAVAHTDVISTTLKSLGFHGQLMTF